MSKKHLSLVAMVGFLVLAMLPALADSAVPPTFVSGSTNCSNVSSAPGGLSLTISEPVMGNSPHVGPDGSVFQLIGTTRKKFDFSTTALVYDVVVKGSASNWYDYDGPLGPGPVRSDTDLEIPNGNKLNLIHFCYIGNGAPVATADAYSTNEDTVLTVPASTGVLLNDSDPDGDPLTAVEVSDPGSRVTLNANGSFTFTPAANFAGSYIFSYKANDGFIDSNTVNVTITVNAVNDAPVAVDDSLSGPEDTVITGNVLTNDTDADGDSLTASKVTDPANGELTLGTTGAVTYTPDANFSGSDSFTYKANDGTVDSNVATVSITVNAVNDPPVAVDDSASVAAGGSVLIDVLFNDTDVEGDSLSITNPQTVTDRLGSAQIEGGQIRYTPADGFTGTDTFTYTANDGLADSNTATVTVTVFAGEINCGDPAISTSEGDISAEITRLENTTGTAEECVPKLFDFDVISDEEAVVFIPVDSPGAEPQDAAYQAVLTFNPNTAVGGELPDIALEYDQLDDGIPFFEPVPWCTGDPFVNPDRPGSINTGVISDFHTWCIVSASTQVFDGDETQTTWLLVGKGDPVTRVK